MARLMQRLLAVRRRRCCAARPPTAGRSVGESCGHRRKDRPRPWLGMQALFSSMRSSLSRESDLPALLEHLLEEIRTALEVMAIRAAGDIPERGGDVQLGGDILVARAPGRPAL